MQNNDDILHAIKSWKNIIVKYSQTKFGREYVNMYLKFLIYDATKEGLSIQYKSLGEYRVSMCLLISTILRKYPKILAKSRFAELFMINGISVHKNALDSLHVVNPLASVSNNNKEIVRQCLAMFLTYCNQEMFKNMFYIGIQKYSFHWTSHYCIFQLKVALFKRLDSLFGSRGDETTEDKLRDLDAYFMSLAILGRDAAVIHFVSEYDPQFNPQVPENTSDVKEYFIQSLLDPNFNFERFISEGQMAMFYDIPIMVNEMNFVCARVKLSDEKRSIKSLSKLYKSDLSLQSLDNWIFSTNSAGAALCRLHGTKKTVVYQKMYDDLRNKIGNRIYDPVQAFTRHF